jgi:hypothetical protein
MAIGDIKFSELKIGGVDLNDPNQAYPDEINIYEDILNSYGPALEIRAIDPTDALGKNSINGSYDQDINIAFSDDMGKTVRFKFKQLENSNLTDEAQFKQGSLHAKSYTIKGVSQELLNAQGNYVQKSWEDKTTNIARDILKDNYKTDKQIEIDDDSKEKRRWIASNEHPLKQLQKLNEEHVASQSQSSAYAIFPRQEKGNSKYKITTYEKLFQQSPVATIKQSTVLDTSASTEEDKRNSIMWMNVGESFFSGSRHLTKSSEQTINLTTHKIVQTDPKQTKFVLPGKEVYQGQTSNHNVVPQRKIYSKLNEPKEQRITPADAKTKRAEFLSHLAQNSAELEIPGNPDITLGSMITLQIPKKVDAGLGGGNEMQFNDKVLVVGVRHRIKPAGKTPRYTQVLKVVKASFSQGGGGSA